MPRSSRIPAALLAVLATWAPAEGYAWGARAHRVISRVAESRLTPAARAGVRALLEDGDTLADIASWADHEGHRIVPGSAPWHYVNVPITASRYDARFARKGGDSIVPKIKHFRAVLADRRAPRSERQVALLFLVHLVQDLHQPLHVGDNRDRGGNDTQIQFLREGTNLHRLWDTDLVNFGSRNDREWLDRVTPLLTRANVEEWSRGRVEDWADESLRAAKKAYFYPEGSATPIPTGTRLGEDYAGRALPVIRERLAQAGVRLANELNAAFR